jgi:cytochrome c peroxidase
MLKRHAWVFVVAAAALPFLQCSSSGPVGVQVPATAQDAGADGSTSLCVDGKPALRYPTGPATFKDFQVIPELTLAGERGEPVSVAKYFDACAPQAKLLVFRVTASFCGPCRYVAGHTDVLNAPGVTLVDVLVRDEYNLPASPAAVPTYRGLGGMASGHTEVLLDPKHQFAGLTEAKLALPLYVFVDARTMKLLSYDANPTAEELRDRMKIELAVLRKEPRPKYESLPKTDGLFTPDQWDMLREMSLPGPPPPDPSNAVADSPAAAAFGEKVFFDAAFSSSGTTSCATCHMKDKDFQDGKPRSTGAAIGDRNAPTILFAAHHGFQFWDGRADSLWMQAIGPLENEAEMASTRMAVVRRVAANYAQDYATAFSPVPDLSDTSRFPAEGKPGMLQYDAMAAADKQMVTRIFVNVGKAIEAYERTQYAESDPLQDYILGDFAALDSHAKGALKDWFVAGCIQCHWGPLLSDGAFHNIRFPTGRKDGLPDEGAALGLPKLLASEFRQSGPYSDAPMSAPDMSRFTPEAIASLKGAFRTPVLRGTAKTGPWGHGGTEDTLLKVLEIYGKAGIPMDDTRAVGAAEPWLTPFDDHVRESLGHLLPTLTGGAHAH